MKINFWELDSVSIRAILSEKQVSDLVSGLVKHSKAQTFLKKQLISTLSFYHLDFLSKGLSFAPEKLTSDKLSSYLTEAIKSEYKVSSAPSKFGRGVNKDAILAAVYLILQVKKAASSERMRSLEGMLKAENGFSSFITSIFRGKGDRLCVPALNLIALSLNIKRDSIQKKIQGYVIGRGLPVSDEMTQELLDFARYTCTHGSAYLVRRSLRMQYTFKQDQQVEDFKRICKTLDLPLLQHRKREFMLHRINTLTILSAYLGVDLTKVQANRKEISKAIEGVQERFNKESKSLMRPKKRAMISPGKYTSSDMSRDVHSLIYSDFSEEMIDSIYERLLSASSKTPSILPRFHYLLIIKLVSAGRATITRKGVLVRDRASSAVIKRIGMPGIEEKKGVIIIPRGIWDYFSESNRIRQKI